MQKRRESACHMLWLGLHSEGWLPLATFVFHFLCTWKLIYRSLLQELLVALKHVLGTDFKRGLFPLIDTLLDERYAFWQTGYAWLFRFPLSLSGPGLWDYLLYMRCDCVILSSCRKVGKKTSFCNLCKLTCLVSDMNLI